MTASPFIVSYVVCTYGRTQYLRECVECFRRAFAPGDELVILNDATCQELRCGVTGVRVTNAKQRFDSLGQKRMAAALLAENQRVVFIDDDDIFFAGYAPHLARGAWVDGLPSAWAATHWASTGRGADTKVFFKPHRVCGSFLTTRGALVACGGFNTLDSGEDQVIEQRLARVGNSYPPPGGPPHYIYRWANGVHHVSGAGNATAWAGCEAELKARVDSGREPTGVVWIEPHWEVDYEKLCADAWKELNP